MGFWLIDEPSVTRATIATQCKWPKKRIADDPHVYQVGALEGGMNEHIQAILLRLWLYRSQQTRMLNGDSVKKWLSLLGPLNAHRTVISWSMKRLFTNVNWSLTKIKVTICCMTGADQEKRNLNREPMICISWSVHLRDFQVMFVLFAWPLMISLMRPDGG